MAGLASEIIIVSGLPRSGTSLMMQMLERGGVELVTDRLREADADNPLGYCEFEQVKSIKRDAAWLPSTRGKAVKMISQLLYDLPPTESYRVIMMERDLDEVLASQEKMLERRNQPAAPRGSMKQAYQLHLERLRLWLARQPHLAVLAVNYNNLLAFPQQEAARVQEFLGERLDPQAMLQAIDPTLYRNRNRLN